MTQPTKDPLQKALIINLDNQVYGTIAEIGGGQETARWFFRAGGAAGTVAKSMSVCPPPSWGQNYFARDSRQLPCHAGGHGLDLK